MDLTQRVLDEFQAFMDQHITARNLAKPLVIGVSGGVDSMVLLHLCAQYCKQTGHSMLAVHVNHNLRLEAAKDEAFVQGVCDSLGIPFCVKSVNVASLRKSARKGLEADARSLRYDAFVECANEFDAVCVLLGHHADDQLETVLWRLLRGTSLTGLSGIRPHTVRDGHTWLRPLLSFAKSDLYAFAHGHDISFIEDMSNHDTEFTRNHIRANIVPLLKQLQPDVAQRVLRTTRILADEDAYIEEQARMLVDQVSSLHRGRYYIHTDRLSRYAVSLQRRVIKIILYCLASVEWTSTHVEDILDIAKSTHPSLRIDLKRGLAAWKEYDLLVLGSALEPVMQAYDRQWDLADEARVSMTTSSGTWTFVCREWDSAMGLCAPSQNELFIPRRESIHLRPAISGERFHPLGMAGTKKLQDLFTDKKVPRHLRQQWPILVSPEGIVWIPGLARAGVLLLQSNDTSGWVIHAEFQSDPILAVPSGHGSDQTHV